MLFFTLTLLKTGIDDARWLHVYEVDLWILLFLGMLIMHRNASQGWLILGLAVCLQSGVKFNGWGNGDRDVLLVLLLVHPWHHWLMIVLTASLLALCYATTRHRQEVPFIFFLSIGQCFLLLIQCF